MWFITHNQHFPQRRVFTDLSPGRLDEFINVPFIIVQLFNTLTEQTRSSATAEKQRVSCACRPRLANWLCNAQNTTESQRLYYFLTLKCSDSGSAGRRRILTRNSHSRSFILQSVTGRQGVACRHIILLAVSLKFSKTQPPKSLKKLPPMSFDAPSKTNLREYPHEPYISRN